MDDKQLQELNPEEEQEFSLDEIMKEFGGEPAEAEEEAPAEEPVSEEEAVLTDDTIAIEVVEEAVTDDTIRIEAVEEALSDDTVRMEPVDERMSDDTIRIDPVETEEAVTGDTIRLDTVQVDAAIKELEGAAPVEEEPFSDQWEPEYEQPMGEYVAPQPIIFHPRSRLRELKRKLVAGPEKRYYALSEQGLGKLQVGIFLSILIVLLCAGSTVMYAMGMVNQDRLRLMIFGQFLAMLVSALLGSNQLIDGVADLFKGRFSLNTLLVFTFIACCADAVMCLQQLRVPCCAAFSLEMTMCLWAAYERRNTEMGQMDTMRKATHLDSLSGHSDYYNGKKGFLRGEGQVEDFMDHYAARSTPEKVLGWYALAALLAAIALGGVALVLHGLSAGIQVAAVTLLAATPATAFITLTRPMAILERKLHDVGAVICGWRGVQGLCGKAVFPVEYKDLIPAGCVKMNGVKFFGSRPTDEIVAYCTALVVANNSGLAPVFTQVLDSRNGRHYDVSDYRLYDNGGIGGIVADEPVLVGSMAFLKEMGVDVPEGLKVDQAVCVAVDGELCGLFALSFEAARSSSIGLAALCGNRGLNPVVVADDFLLTQSFIQGRFGVNPRKILFPEFTEREKLRDTQPGEESPVLALSTREGLAAFACSVAGARALRKASRMGLTIHLVGGILGIAMMATLTVLGALELLTPANMFAYQLLWMIPGLLITEWTRTV